MVVEVQAKVFPISESEKFRQHLFVPFYHHFQQPSEPLRGSFLRLFDVLNPAIASI
jgi:hypothetical protein